MKIKLRHALLALLVASCVAGEPTGPPVAILTVSSDAPLDAAAVAPDAEASATPARAGRDDHALLAALLCAPGDASADGALPGSAATLAERATAAGFEAAAFVTGAATREEGGLTQGHFHGYDGPSLAALAPDDPLEHAVALAEAYIADKLPRPMEDASFVWVHLDLAGLDAAEAERRAADAWSRLGAAHGDRETLRVLALLPAGDEPGALASNRGAPDADATLYDLVAEQAALPALEARASGNEVCTTHYPSGEIWAVRRYTEGAPDHPWIAWHINERPQSEYRFDAGARTGRWRSFADNGVPIFEREYVDDALHGGWLRRFANGDQAAEGSFERGVRSGLWRAWHPNGQLALEVEYAAGVPVAPARRFDADGNPVDSDS